MIPVAQQPQPTLPEYDFQHDVYERGEDAIRQLAGLAPSRIWRGRPIKARVNATHLVTHEMLRDYDYWTRAMPALHRAYGGMCAYLARYIELDEVATTDHFVALHNASTLMQAYTWSNYRLACGLMNGRKSDFPHVLDPFAVGDGWFALDLASFKTIPGPNAPSNQLDAIKTTIERLGLDSAEVAETRRRWANHYLKPGAGRQPIPWWHLEAEQPFLARELRRQGMVREGDPSVT